eukprot:scaffold17_cov354-Pavlova_lutheri.AAC.50
MLCRHELVVLLVRHRCLVGQAGMAVASIHSPPGVSCVHPTPDAIPDHQQVLHGELFRCRCLCSDSIFWDGAEEALHEFSMGGSIWTANRCGGYAGICQHGIAHGKGGDLGRVVGVPKRLVSFVRVYCFHIHE